MLRDYLGQHEEFPLAIMHAYVDFVNFAGMLFNIAIREFLKGFRLPGEAQKIDRIMEKFAEQMSSSTGSKPENDAVLKQIQAIIKEKGPSFTLREELKVYNSWLKPLDGHYLLLLLLPWVK